MKGRAEHRRHSRHVTRGQRWRTLRMAILERDGFKCRHCGQRGRLEIDHVKPVRDAPELAYAPRNLQALCPACHTKKTRLECGHPPLSPGAQAWRDAVSALTRRGHRPNPPKTQPKPEIEGKTDA